MEDQYDLLRWNEYAEILIDHSKKLQSSLQAIKHSITRYAPESLADKPPVYNNVPILPTIAPKPENFCPDFFLKSEYKTVCQAIIAAFPSVRDLNKVPFALLTTGHVEFF
jgi:hypothetical protein